jgi:S1-C subfamily serine protease
MSDQSNGTLSLSGAAVGLGVALVALFVICAVVQLIAPNIQATHAWIGLFTTAELPSLRAWIEGIVFSVVFGLVVGGIFALAYNRIVMRNLWNRAAR